MSIDLCGEFTFSLPDDDTSSSLVAEDTASALLDTFLVDDENLDLFAERGDACLPFSCDV